MRIESSDRGAASGAGLSKGRTPMLNMYPAMLHSALEQLEKAVHDHAEWHEHLLRVIFCGEPMQPGDLSPNANRRCHFGRWSNNLAPTELRERPSFAVLCTEHERLHQVAARLLHDVETDSPVLRRDFDELVACSAGFRLALDGLRHEIEAVLRNRDALTGAFSRVEMLPELRRWHEMAKQGGRPCSVALMDLDHLKEINDTQGYDLGDQVLAGAVRFVAEHLRARDKVFRYGGSAFVISLPGADLATGQTAIGRVRDALVKRLVIIGVGGVPVPVTASFGIALLDPEVGVVDSIDRAEQALMLAKAAGRNRIISWDPAVTTGPRLKRLTIESPSD